MSALDSQCIGVANRGTTATRRSRLRRLGLLDATKPGFEAVQTVVWEQQPSCPEKPNADFGREGHMPIHGILERIRICENSAIGF